MMNPLLLLNLGGMQTTASTLFVFMGPALIALLIGLFLYSLMYMIGSFLGKQDLNIIAKDGIMDVFAIFLFLLFVGALVGFIDGATPSSFGLDLVPTSGAPAGRELMTALDVNNLPIFELAQVYLNMLFHFGMKLYMALLLQILHAGAFESVRVGSGGFGTTLPFGGYGILLNFAPMVLGSTAIMLLSVSAQIYLLLFMKEFAKILLPLGAALRVIPPTRRVGASMIAFTFVLLILYPLMLSYNLYVFATILKDDVFSDESLDAINMVLYNRVPCQSGDDCASGVCNNGVCKTCVIAGPVGDKRFCCEGSEYKNGECVLNNNEKGNLRKIMEGTSQQTEVNKAGGIFIYGGTSADTYLLWGAMIVGGLGLLGRLISMSSLAGKILNIVTLIAAPVFKVGILGSAYAAQVILNPIFTLVLVFFYNRPFFFIFVLTAIEFVIIVEIARNITAALGEPIDIVKIVKVI